MTVKALYDYDFPSADRAENFGPDMLVYVWWQGNPLLSAAAAFRVPQDLPFGEFVETVVTPWASSHPEFEPGSTRNWRLFDQELDLSDTTRSLTALGLTHKALLSFDA